MRLQSMLTVFTVILLPLLSIGQSNSNNQYKHKRYTGTEISVSEVIEELCVAKDINPTSLITTSDRKSPNGYQHKKYSQFYEGLEVYGTSYIIHTNDNFVVSSNGYLAQDVNIKTTPRIKESKAITIAKKAMVGNQYFDDRVKPIELMIIDKAFPKVSSKYSLVYKVEVYTSEPIDKKIFFVDAMNGSILLDLPGLIHESTPATAHTKYHGVQEIITQSTPEGDYILQDLTRGDGITTLNYDMTPFRNSTTDWNLTNVDQDEVALDAHYATEKFYDMMLQRLGWDGLDGNGLSMNPIVHANGGNDFVNAFWDGQNAWFGNGDCHRGPLTTLEVVAHEFMHGITDYTSDLIYSGESGAINESMSDIFGKAVEFYFAPEEFDWSIGESFILTEGFEPFRYMDNPNLKGMPAYYRGQYWGDNNGVHTNSAIGNLWFHILVEGKSDTTETGESYNVSGMGMDKAIEIAWQVQSNYLTSTSTYQDYYESSVDVATSMFGDESPELADVIEAWRAVGLPPTVFAQERDLSIKIENTVRRQCIGDDYLPITITITNSGSVDFSSADNVAFQLNQIFDINKPNAPNLEILIAEDLVPGESITFQIDTFLQVPNLNYHLIEVSFLNIEDDNSSNNSDRWIIENFEPTYYSLYSRMDLGTENCQFDSLYYNVEIRNTSCSSIPANTTLNYFVTSPDDPNFSIEESIILDESLGSDEIILINLTGLDKNLLELSSFAFSSTNTSPDTLTTTSSANPKNKIFGEYSDLMDDYDNIIAELDVFSIVHMVEYNGNTYLSKSGRVKQEDFFSCPDPIEDFRNIGAYENGFSEISACVNLEELENPILSFDLVQFRNNNDFLPQFDGLRTRAKISWGDGTNEFIIVEGLTEGVEEKISIPLPSNFIGEFSIIFLNITGIWFDGSNTDEYLEYDANLIRNLEIKNVTSTEEEILNNEIRISPNPGNGLYLIDSPYPIDQIEIRDVHGRSIKKIPNDNNTINIESIESGYYIMVMKLNDGRSVSKPIINIKR